MLSGLCTGLFAATAIAASPSISTLLPVAVQVVLMAFRTGHYVASMAEKLNPSVQGQGSWTYVLPGVNEFEARSILAEFHEVEVGVHHVCFYLDDTNISLAGHFSCRACVYQRHLW